MSSARPWLLSAAILASACEGDQIIDRVASTGFFTPAELEFGVVGIGETQERQTILRNTSGASMTVLNTAFDPDLGAFVVRNSSGGTVFNLKLAPGSAETLTLRCSPPSEGAYSTSVLMRLEGDLEIALPVTAEARLLVPATPVLEPASVSFQDVEVGRSVHQRIRIRNGGDLEGTLKILDRVQPPFTITDLGGAPLPTLSPVLSPGEELEVEVHFLPTAVGSASGMLRIQLDGQESLLRVQGSGQTPGVLSCDQTRLSFGTLPRGMSVRRTVQCQASGGAYALGTIEMASGSASVFRIPSAPSALDANRSVAFEVEFQAVGLPASHVGAVHVVAAHGVVVSIPTDGEVAPPLPGSTDMTLRLSWNSTATDFDLHLVRAGRPLFDPTDDCYFQNKNPDWGVPGDGGDDPYLDRDDTDGFGPEELNLSSAQENSYDAYVQFFNYVGSSPPTTTAFLTIELRGQNTQTVSADILSCGDTWLVGRFTFPEGGIPSFQRLGQVVSDYRSFANVKCR